MRGHGEQPGWRRRGLYTPANSRSTFCRMCTPRLPLVPLLSDTEAAFVLPMCIFEGDLGELKGDTVASGKLS